MEEENKARRSSALLNVTDSAAESGQPVVAVIKRSNAAEDTILIPLLSDQSSITLATLQSHFPDAIGLKYKVREEWYAVTLDALGTSFLNPIGGWAAKTFEIRTMESKTSPGSERSNLPEWNEGVVEYLLETEDGCCVTVIAKRGAVTCYRCLDDQIAVDDLINVKLCRGNPLTKFPNGQQSAVLKVAYIDRITDLVFMVAAIDLCHKPPVPGYARYGLPYVILGLVEWTGKTVSENCWIENDVFRWTFGYQEGYRVI
uniref:TAR DNA-binding protein 43 N-terminal domain-containing protein n=1 Tax=Panagrolaimus sp. JU765 TaxID=591449 RepID=A0AC34REA2_9BILA